ncbi:virulence-associated E family protein [Schaalia radingae]|uniref:Predicted P-loop ATPase and inactivated derivatives n=1 Tax=Schaalia radingae TaxID=131110 RepID=A0ABY0V4Y5_9ACTO|nr:virulence-associated E family protein [Schaalia radingae]SDT85796.1 Predicted P-loop ATPase and inactivated derivatives [Schaalia radingae]
MKISSATTRRATRWTNTETTWDEFTSRLAVPKRTSETTREYQEMSRDQQSSVKDVGGFVAGHLKDGVRRNGSVLSRSMLTLDVDQPEPDFWSMFTILYNNRAVLYSTHSHTAERPRLRLIVPLSRDVSEDEYPAVGRMIANTLGIHQFDSTTYQAPRLMYWPSCPSDGDYVYETQDGPLLNPDTVLGQYEDWQDMRQWPRADSEPQPRAVLSEMEDPTLKTGVVGAFCRAYTMEQAIEKFLPTVYEPTGMSDRYTYTQGETTGGLIVYEHKRAYSHHATDPAAGRALNAFDLVRIHLYGHLDNETDPSTPVSELPSHEKMCLLATSDEKVQEQLDEDRAVVAEREFTDLEPDTHGGNTTTTTDSDRGWVKQLELTKNGAPKDTVSNYTLILENDPRLQGLAYNQMSESIIISNPKILPWKPMTGTWSDTDEAHLRVWVQKRYGIYSQSKLHDALIAVATSRAYHPVRDYLTGLPEWDHTPRLDTLLIKYLGAEDTVYVREATRKTLVAAVARVLHPGTKFDNVLILNGPQGIGKSYIFNRLGGKFFSDSLTISDMRDKTGAEKTRDAWILELGELAGMRKMDAETVKSFITRTHDKYRPAYGRNVETHARECIIVGTTNNEDGFLRDVTGNRRFWPVMVTGETTRKPWDLTGSEIGQVWAEAAYYCAQGEKLYLTGEAARLAGKAQAGSMETDDREGMVRAYLETPLPADWDERDLFERRSYLSLKSAEQHGQRRTVVSNIEIWCECLERKAADFTTGESYRIASIMSRIEGWERGSAKDRLRIPLYGRQRVYRRVER